MVNSPDEPARVPPQPTVLTDPPRAVITQQTVIPVVVEQATVGTAIVETGRVILEKRVTEHSEIIGLPLTREEVRVERHPVGRPIEGEAPQPRYEGDTLILPVLEEILVVRTQWVLKEELHVHKVRVPHSDPQTVTLRAEEVDVRRTENTQHATARREEGRTV
jgi:uncharacterized protein (TIGR02271 family)